MDRYTGTCWRLDISPWFENPKCDVFLLMLEEPDFLVGLVRCLIIGIDNDDYEMRPGYTVEAKVKDLRPLF